MADGGRARARTRTWPRLREASWRGAIPRAGAWAEPLLEVLRGWVRAERGPGRLLPWIPIAFGAGIAAYFAADREPVLWVVAPAAGVLCAGAAALRRSRWFPWMALAAAALAGFANATWKTERVAHGVLARPVVGADLAGFVEVREERERSDRITLRVERLETARPVVSSAGPIERVRLSVKKGMAPPVGAYVEVKARLSPPFAAPRPGGYDFARDIYFHGVSASGFVLGAIRTVAPPRETGWRLSYAVAVNGMRDAIDARIRAAIGGDGRAIASALLTGKRDAISAPVNEAMFVSGLGHVLSISGYHMAVVTGVVFFAVRALLALVPVLAAGFAIKKWAALVALAAAAFYLALSGAEVATQRSFLMTAVVLFGVLADRRAITFRTLALAACAVLAVAPEALVHPSFQMSFAATLALVALVERGMPLMLAAPDNSSVSRAALWGTREIAMLILASLVAGLATMPYAAFHFHRATPYGAIANLLAMPVVSAFVMPAGLLGLAAMPFGFDGVFWRLMDAGIGWMIAVAQWVAALPGSVGRIAAFGTGPLLLASLGIVLLGLLKSPLRWSGALALAWATALALTAPRPDVLIATDGQSIAVRGADGRLAIVQTRTDAFVQRDWLAADADGRAQGDPSIGAGTACDDAGCAVRLGDGAYVTIAKQPAAFADDCVKAAVIVTAHEPPASCAALVVRREDLERSGSLALTRDGKGWRREAVKPAGSARPWYGDAAVAAAPAQPGQRAPAPAQDATPAEADLTPEDQ